MRIPMAMVVFTVMAAQPALAVAQAQDLDCAAHVKAARSAIDKVTEDMKGMESMPKDQLRYVNTLLNDAKKLAEAAQQTCGKPKNDYDRAWAIAKAEASRGSAEAADMLHWHFMKAMPGMRDESSGQAGHGDAWNEEVAA